MRFICTVTSNILVTYSNKSYIFRRSPSFVEDIPWNVKKMQVSFSRIHDNAS